MAGYKSFLFSEGSLSADSITLDTRESHHLIRVLRARQGDRLTVLDGNGIRYEGEICQANAKAVQVNIDEVKHSEASGVEVVLLQAMPKGKAMDLILRMATEIGVSCIVPVFTDHGEVRISSERLNGKHEKWQMTLVEACKQCGVPWLPSLESPLDLRNWLEGNSIGGDELRIVASLEAETLPLVQILSEVSGIRRIVVAVGPEGDFSEREYSALKDSGFRAVRLGRNVLRAETAAAYILSVVDQLNLSKPTICP